MVFIIGEEGVLLASGGWSLGLLSASCSAESDPAQDVMSTEVGKPCSKVSVTLWLSSSSILFSAPKPPSQRLLAPFIEAIGPGVLLQVWQGTGDILINQLICGSGPNVN